MIYPGNLDDTMISLMQKCVHYYPAEGRARTSVIVQKASIFEGEEGKEMARKAILLLRAFELVKRCDHDDPDFTELTLIGEVYKEDIAPYLSSLDQAKQTERKIREAEDRVALTATKDRKRNHLYQLIALLISVIALAVPLLLKDSSDYTCNCYQYPANEVKRLGSSIIQLILNPADSVETPLLIKSDSMERVNHHTPKLQPSPLPKRAPNPSRPAPPVDK